MTVATFSQPDSTVEAPSAWGAKVDAVIAVLARMAAPFAPHAQATPDMTARLDAGSIFNPVTLARAAVAAQSTGTITAPAADPRYDIVYVDRESGAVGVATGSEDASPADPAVPAGKVPVARLRLTVGMTTITDADLDDLRDLFALGLPFGGGANDIVTLDGSGALPAVDGSALTGVTDAGLTADMRLAFLKLAELDGDRLNMVAGIADPYADETDVDTAASSGQTYDAGGGYYTDAVSPVLISQATGTAIGDMTAYGGLAAAFDGATSQGIAACARTAVAVFSGYIGKNFGSPKTVRQVRVYGSNDYGFCTTAGSITVTLEVYGKSSAPSGGTDGTLLHEVSFIDPNDGTPQLLTIASPAAYAYVWVLCSTTGSGAGETNAIAEIEFYEAVSPSNMSLVSEAFTAGVAPDSGRVHIQVTEVDAVTINTDLMADISRDDGANWATATLALAATLADGTKAYEDTAVDLSGQPSGTAMRYRVRTANAKEIRAHGAVLQWA